METLERINLDCKRRIKELQEMHQKRIYSLNVAAYLTGKGYKYTLHDDEDNEGLKYFVFKDDCSEEIEEYKKNEELQKFIRNYKKIKEELHM